MSTPPRWLAALLGTPGSWLAFGWGFAEGTLFFVVPDVAFTLTTALRPWRGLLQLGLAVAGALLAGHVMYSSAVAHPRRAQATVAAVPLVGQKMLADTERRFEARGARAMFERPLGGVPYKVYAVLAPSHLSHAQFLLVTLPARAERMLLTWAPVALIALGLRRMEEARRLHLVQIAHPLCWLALYGYYWSALTP